MPGIIVKLIVAGRLVPVPLVAVTSTEELPAVVGVPDIRPLVVFNVNPPGKVPLDIA